MEPASLCKERGSDSIDTMAIFNEILSIQVFNFEILINYISV